MSFFKETKSRWTVQSKGRIPSSHLNQLALNGEVRTSERFENLRLDCISVIDSHLSHCTFSNIHARSVSLGGGLTQSTYADCVFEDCSWIFATVGNVRLSRCEFHRCRLSDLVGTKLEMVRCTFDQTSIRKGVFHGIQSSAVPGHPTRKRNEFSENDFSGADLIDVDFRGGIDLTRQRLPTGGGYLFVGDTCRALEVAKQLLSLPLSAVEMQRVQSEIFSLQRYCSSGQTTQLLRLSDWGALADEFKRRLQ
jgi:hypothetical protein